MCSDKTIKWVALSSFSNLKKPLNFMKDVHISSVLLSLMVRTRFLVKTNFTEKQMHRTLLHAQLDMITTQKLVINSRKTVGSFLTRFKI